LAGLFFYLFLPPLAVVTFCFRLSPLRIASCNFKANAVCYLNTSDEFDHSTQQAAPTQLLWH
jgi:hypothetical protein